MSSIFLEGLKSAREIMQTKGMTKLDDLIQELETGEIETAAIAPAVETR